MYKTTRRNINGCSLLGDKGRIRKTGLEQGNTDGRGKQGRNRETQQDSENGNQRQQESQKLIRWLDNDWRKVLNRYKTGVEEGLSCEENKKTPQNKLKTYVHPVDKKLQINANGELFANFVAIPAKM